MIGDFLYKLIRKTLNSGFYKGLSSSFLGRDKSYHQPETYRNIHRHYSGQGFEIRDRVILEVGPGAQLFTAFYWLTEGAREVFIVDPAARPESFGDQLREFTAFTGHALDENVFSRLRFYPDVSLVPDEFNGKIDLFFSHLSLEHVPDLDSFYFHHYRLLSPTGASYHRVDLTDHTYHVLGNFSLAGRFAHGRLLHHWRYSDRTFRFLNDPKCFMNRQLLPVHLHLVKKMGFQVDELRRSPYGTVPVHPELLASLGDYEPQDLFVTEFSFKLRKHT